MSRIVDRLFPLAIVAAGVLQVISLADSVHEASAQTGSQMMLDVDSPDSGASVASGQRFLVGGWAVALTGGISSVDVYLDGAPGGGGTWLGSANLGGNRQDVASRFGHPEWSSSGYDFYWVPRDLSQGEHTLYVVARSTSGQTSTQLVTVTGCGCGLRGSMTNPIVTGLGSLGWELDTGGPAVWMERPSTGPDNNR